MRQAFGQIIDQEFRHNSGQIERVGHITYPFCEGGWAVDCRRLLHAGRPPADARSRTSRKAPYSRIGDQAKAGSSRRARRIPAWVRSVNTPGGRRHTVPFGRPQHVAHPDHVGLEHPRVRGRRGRRGRNEPYLGDHGTLVVLRGPGRRCSLAGWRDRGRVTSPCGGVGEVRAVAGDGDRGPAASAFGQQQDRGWCGRIRGEG